MELLVVVKFLVFGIYMDLGSCLEHSQMTLVQLHVISPVSTLSGLGPPRCGSWPERETPHERRLLTPADCKTLSLYEMCSSSVAASVKTDQNPHLGSSSIDSTFRVLRSHPRHCLSAAAPTPQILQILFPTVPLHPHIRNRTVIVVQTGSSPSDPTRSSTSRNST